MNAYTNCDDIEKTFFTDNKKCKASCSDVFLFNNQRGVPTILVGNKCDLLDDPRIREKLKVTM